MRILHDVQMRPSPPWCSSRRLTVTGARPGTSLSNSRFRGTKRENLLRWLNGRQPPLLVKHLLVTQSSLFFFSGSGGEQQSRNALTLAFHLDAKNTSRCLSLEKFPGFQKAFCSWVFFGRQQSSQNRFRKHTLSKRDYFKSGCWGNFVAVLGVDRQSSNEKQLGDNTLESCLLGWRLFFLPTLLESNLIIAQVLQAPWWMKTFIAWKLCLIFYALY